VHEQAADFGEHESGGGERIRGARRGGEEKWQDRWRKGMAEHSSHEVADRKCAEMHELRLEGTPTGVGKAKASRDLH